MNRNSIYTQFAQFAERSDKYSFEKHSIVEQVMAYFGLNYKEKGIATTLHEENLQILKKYIIEQASEEQLTWLNQEIINHNPYKNACSNDVFLGMVMDEGKLADCNKIQTAIETAIKNTNNFVYASNNDLKTGNITDRIFDAILSCKFSIFDFTSQNSGVYFEAGYALAKGKTVLLTCKKNDYCNLHFDVNHIRFILWKDYDDLKNQLEEAICQNNLKGGIF